MSVVADPVGARTAGGSVGADAVAVIEAIGDLGVPVVCDDLGGLLRSRDVLEAKLSAGIGEVDAAELWDLEHATSMAAWVRTVLRTTHSHAQRVVSRARKLRPLPETRAAWEAGRISTAQVDAILARLTTRRLERFIEDEEQLVGQIANLDGQDTVELMGAWANIVDDLLHDPTDTTEQPDTSSEVYASRSLDGRTELAGSLAPDLGSLVRAALRAATTRDGAEDPARSPAQARADALADVCKFFLDHHDHQNPTPKNRPHVGIVLDWDALLHEGQGTLLDTGEAISAETIQQILCDAAVHRILRKGVSTILDLGRTTAVVSPAQHAALAVRDDGCRWPDCDRPASWCDAHHIRPWGSQRGPTALGNLALLCRRHHRRIHRKDTRAWIDLVTAALTIELPGGRVIRSMPRPRPATTGPPA
jgi:hypothetical protein